MEVPVVVNKYKSDYDVYIGRGLGSPWGNPFTHIKDKTTKAEFIVDTREESIEKYREYLYNKISTGEISVQDLLDLQGKRLGCFCSPLPCHGDVLVEIVETIIKMSEDNETS